MGKAFGRLGLVRAARAMCAAGTQPQDVTAEALEREMLRPFGAPQPGGVAADTDPGELAAEAAAIAGEPDLAINIGPPGVCCDFLPWQARESALGARRHSSVL